MKLKRINMIILSAVLTCTAPAAVYAEDIAEQISDAVTEDAIDSLMNDPDKVVDIIVYVKEFIDQQDITDEDIRSAIDLAGEHFEVNLSDSDKDAILKLAKKFKDMEVDREQLKKDVKKVYGAMEFFGIDAEDVKGILDKAVDFIRGILD